MGYAGNVLHSMDMKLDQGLQLQCTILDKQDLTLQIARETKEEIFGL